MDCAAHVSQLSASSVQSVVYGPGSGEYAVQETGGNPGNGRVGASRGVVGPRGCPTSPPPVKPSSNSVPKTTSKVAARSSSARTRKENMLKFLTHKLRTHSINEDFSEKADENHDSGTESDEDVENADLPSSVVERMCSISPADTGCSMESPAPDQHDSHSSEEELEVINSNKVRPVRPFRAASVCLPEKRKWSQIGDTYPRKYTPENEENMSHYGNLSPSSPCSPYLKCCEEGGIHIEPSGSSDDEVHHLLASMATPKQFCTSPPLEALKPGRRSLSHKGRSMSPPPKLLHYEESPRKRSRHGRHHHLQRPHLDFEKMQQLTTKSPVTSWKSSGDSGGELSFYCW